MWTVTMGLVSKALNLEINARRNALIIRLGQRRDSTCGVPFLFLAVGGGAIGMRMEKGEAELIW